MYNLVTSTKIYLYTYMYGAEGPQGYTSKNAVQREKRPLSNLRIMSSHFLNVVCTLKRRTLGYKQLGYSFKL